LAEGNRAKVEKNGCAPSAKRQQSLLESGFRRFEPKISDDYSFEQRHSEGWGDPTISGSEIEEQKLFRFLSHNVGGLSTADYSLEMKRFAKAM
jgi:hypothetical protein